MAIYIAIYSQNWLINAHKRAVSEVMRTVVFDAHNVDARVVKAKSRMRRPTASAPAMRIRSCEVASERHKEA